MAAALRAAQQQQQSLAQEASPRTKTFSGRAKQTMVTKRQQRIAESEGAKSGFLSLASFILHGRETKSGDKTMDKFPGVCLPLSLCVLDPSTLLFLGAWEGLVRGATAAKEAAAAMRMTDASAAEASHLLAARMAASRRRRRSHIHKTPALAFFP